MWIYDYRTNIKHTLKTNPLRLDHLQDFIQCYQPANRHDRQETERFRSFSYEDIISRDKTSLDIFWLKDDSLGDLDNLPDPDQLAMEIVDNLESALGSFRQIVNQLQAG